MIIQPRSGRSGNVDSFSELASVFPDSPQKWDEENFAFFSEIALQLNNACTDFELTIVILESAMLNMRFNNAAKRARQARHVVRMHAARCRFMEEVKSAVELNRWGSGSGNKSVRECARTRKGIEDC